MNLKRGLLLALKILVSVSLVWYLLASVGIREALERARALSAGTAATVLAILLCYTTVSSARWLAVLRAIGAPASLGFATRITFVGAFFNQFLPTSVGGDAMRVWECYRSGIALGKTVNSVMLERATYILAVSLLAAVATTAWDEGQLPAGSVTALWMVFVAGCAGIALLALAHRLPTGKLPESVARIAGRVSEDARALLRRPAHLCAIFATALVNQALLVASVMVIAHGLGAPIRVLDCVALLPAITLVSSVPISVAGWGVREYAMITGFGYAGVPPSVALVISVALAILSICAALPGGALWLLARRPVDSR